MIRLPRTRITVAAVAAFALAGAGCAADQNPVAADDAALNVRASVEAAAQQRSARAERQFYQAQISPVGDTRVRGVAQFEIVGDYFTAKVRITGLESGAQVPQHIHVGARCGEAGGILVNLDRDLTTLPEGGAPAGELYPTANRGGVLQYEAQRPVSELEAALGEELDLANRTVNFHRPDADLTVVGCGEIRRVN